MSNVKKFPCSKLPENPGDQKLLGLYSQIQDATWLQRIRIPGGRLTSAQWHGLADIARKFTPTTPLHLTTRQDIEVHDLTAELVPQVQHALDAIDLTCFGAAGDTFRNITVCPCSGSGGTVDLMPLAKLIDKTLKGVDGITSLPRKFKIALGCSPDCCQPWINGLAFVAQKTNGSWRFGVTVAGSLGAKPGTGMPLSDWVDPQDVVPLTLAVVEVFAKHGDRENRRKARLRHVRERIGNEALADLIAAAFKTEKAKPALPDVILKEAEGHLAVRATLNFANGDVSPEAADALGDLQADPDLTVSIANQHRVIVFGPDDKYLDRSLSAQPALQAALELKTSVIACPGKRWCSRGIVHTNELADRIRADFADRLPAGATVCISGCPNGCSHPAVADIGLTGCLRTVDGQKQEAFNLGIGGGMGRDDRLARPVAAKLSADEVLAEISRLLDTPAREGGLKQ